MEVIHARQIFSLDSRCVLGRSASSAVVRLDSIRSDGIGYGSTAGQPPWPGWFGIVDICSCPTFSFDLIGPNTTKDDGTANTIVLTGAGSFDTPAGPVVASGTFAIFSAAGAELSGGIWKATAFGNFTSFGGPNPGTQVGVLDITAMFTPAGGTPVPNVSLSVTCLVNKPAGFTGKEGVTVVGGVGNFTDIIRGATLFHMNN